MTSFPDRPHSVHSCRDRSSELVKKSESLVKPISAQEEPKESKPNSFTNRVKLALKRVEKKLDEVMEMQSETQSNKRNQPESSGVLEDILRIEKKVRKQLEEAEKAAKMNKHHEKEMKRLEAIFFEHRMEREVLQEKVYGYLEQISSLRSKIEEQRCAAGAYERQVNAEYESQLRKLENDNEELRNLTVQKEKQVKEMAEQLRQMNLALKSQESQSWQKKKEENFFITMLKNDLQATWNEKIKMEEELKMLKKMYKRSDCFAADDLTLLKKSKSMSDLRLTVEVDNKQQTEGKVIQNPLKICFAQKSDSVSSVPERDSTLQKILEALSIIERKMSGKSEDMAKGFVMFEERESEESADTISMRLMHLSEQIKKMRV